MPHILVCGCQGENKRMGKPVSCTQQDDLEQWIVWRYPVSVRVSVFASLTTGGIGRFSQLDVRKKQYAVVVKDGKVYDCLSMGKYPMTLESFPELAKAFPHPAEGFVSVDIFFLNATIQWSLYFGTSNGPVRVVDPVCFVEYRLYLFGRLVLVPDDIHMFFQNILSFDTSRQPYGVENVLSACRNQINARLKMNISKAINNHKMSVLSLSYPFLAGYVRQMVEQDLVPYGLAIDAFYLDTLRIDDEDLARCLVALQQLSRDNVVEKFPIGVVKRTGSSGVPVYDAHTRVFMRSATRTGSSGVSAYDAHIGICQFCHSEIPALARFCPNCGQLVSKDLHS